MPVWDIVSGKCGDPLHKCVDFPGIEIWQGCCVSGSRSSIEAAPFGFDQETAPALSGPFSFCTSPTDSRLLWRTSVTPSTRPPHAPLRPLVKFGTKLLTRDDQTRVSGRKSRVFRKLHFPDHGRILAPYLYGVNHGPTGDSGHEAKSIRPMGLMRQSGGLRRWSVRGRPPRRLRHRHGSI